MPTDQHDIATAIVCRLGTHVIPPSAREEAGEIAFVARVLREEGCTPGVFRLLDEKPGHDAWGGYAGLHGEWHHRLRRFRNHAPHDLFAESIGATGRETA